MLILYCLNLFVIINSILLTRCFYHKYSVHDKILISFTMYIAQIILFVLLLGILGILTLPNLAILTVSLSLIVFFIFKNKNAYPFFPRSHFIRETLLWIFQHRLLAISISFLLGFSLVKIFQNLINPPFLWGSLVYHFTFPVEWLKSSNLTNPTIVFYVSALSYVAMNAELLFFWFIAPLKSAFIADIASYPFYIMGAVASFSIIRKLGISKEIALLSGILFSLTPQYFKHLIFNGNDIIVTSLYLIALNFALLLKEKFSFKVLAIAAVAIGLAWGTKSNVVLWAPLLIPLIMYFSIRNYKDIKIKNLILLGAIFIIIVLVFGGFTYIRNFIDTGNPLYPVNYEILGIKLKGPIEYANLRGYSDPFNIDFGELLFHQSLGLHFVVLTFPAILFGLPISIIRSRSRLSFDIIYLLALPLLMAVVFYAKAPFHMPSYVYPMVGVGTLTGIYTLNRFKLSAKVMRIILFVLIIAAMAELTGHMALVWSLMISGLLFIGLVLVKNTNTRKFCKVFGISALFAIAIGLIPLESYYEQTKFRNYSKAFHWEKDLTRSWLWVYEQTLHSPKNIAYVGSSAVFPLYGNKFRNNVRYVSVNEKEPYLQNFSRYRHTNNGYREWLDIMRQDGAIREKADFNVWCGNLNKRDTDWLFIMCTDDYEVFPVEDEWAKTHPDVFKPVLANRRVHIYELSKKK